MISEQQVVEKVSVRLIPFMFLLYIVAYLDRVNVSYASLQMNDALGFSAEVYSIGAGIFFIGYFLFEVPSNLIMHRVGARVWMARILVTWGIISAAMMFVSGKTSFYALRFLLGIAEAGFFPGMILYLTYWFPARTRGRAVARFMTALAISGAIGGPISGVILDRLNGVSGLAGWKWLFLLEGIPAVLLGVITLLYLPDGPNNAKWLTSDEKKWIATTLDAERKTLAAHGDHSLRDAMRSSRVWTFAAIYFSLIMSFYGVTFWLPQIVKAFSGTSNLVVGLISADPLSCGRRGNGIHFEKLRPHGRTAPARRAGSTRRFHRPGRSGSLPESRARTGSIVVVCGWHMGNVGALLGVVFGVACRYRRRGRHCRNQFDRQPRRVSGSLPRWLDSRPHRELCDCADRSGNVSADWLCDDVIEPPLDFASAFLRAPPSSSRESLP
jgi:MFS family permease